MATECWEVKMVEEQEKEAEEKEANDMCLHCRKHNCYP